MSQTHDEIRALRVMVDELRAEPPPELPWDAIEQRLLARLAQDERIARPSASTARAVTLAASAFSRVIGFAVAAAVLAFGVSSMSRSGELSVSDAPLRHVVQASAFAGLPAPRWRARTISPASPPATWSRPATSP